MGDRHDHHFKIIYIKMLKEMEPIPHMWEENGVCWFPKVKKDIKLHQCNPASAPDKQNWLTYNCDVKAEGISTWAHANATANSLCDFSSTSEDDLPALPAKRPRKQKPTIEPRYNLNTSDNVSEKMVDVDVDIHTMLQNTSPNDPTNEVAEENDLTLTPLTNTNVVDIATSSELKELSDTVKGYHTEVNTIKSELKNYFDTQFVSLSLKMDEAIKVAQQRDDVIVTSVSTKEELVDNYFFPLSSKAEMQTFEMRLEKEDFKKKIILHLRKIIGSGFPWTQACYKLTNVMFTKQVLVQYSWTGVSRTEVTKDPFNKLNNILGVFFHVIIYADPSFTYAAREIFFRDKILKHSQSRLNSKKKNKENEVPKVAVPETPQTAVQTNNETSQVEKDFEIINENVEEELLWFGQNQN